MLYMRTIIRIMRKGEDDASLILFCNSLHIHISGLKIFGERMAAVFSISDVCLVSLKIVLMMRQP